MARQPLVDKRVVGIEQVEETAVLADDRGEQQLGLATKRLAEIVVEILRACLQARQVAQ